MCDSSISQTRTGIIFQDFFSPVFKYTFGMLLLMCTLALPPNSPHTLQWCPKWSGAVSHVSVIRFPWVKVGLHNNPEEGLIRFLDSTPLALTWWMWIQTYPREIGYVLTYQMEMRYHPSLRTAPSGGTFCGDGMFYYCIGQYGSHWPYVAIEMWLMQLKN